MLILAGIFDLVLSPIRTGLVLQGVIREICVSQTYLVILIPSESATSVFFSHNLCNNSRANYLLFFSKLSDPLRKLIPSECDVCDCWWIFFSQRVSLCVLANVNYRRCSYRAHIWYICLPANNNKKKPIIKSRARSLKLLRLAIAISASGKIICVHFCTQLHNVLITYVPLWKLNTGLLQIYN